MTLSLSVYLLCRVWMCAWECASGATGAPAPCLSGLVHAWVGQIVLNCDVFKT